MVLFSIDDDKDSLVANVWELLEEGGWWSS